MGIKFVAMVGQPDRLRQRVNAVTSSSEMAASDRDSSPELGVVVSLPGVETFDAFYAREYRLLVAFAYALTGSQAHASRRWCWAAVTQ